MLHDFSGQGERLVYSCFDGGLANRDEPGLVGFEVLSRLMELPAGQRPATEPLGDDADVRAVHPLDDVWPAVFLVDHGRVELADHSGLVQALDGISSVGSPDVACDPTAGIPGPDSIIPGE